MNKDDRSRPRAGTAGTTATTKTKFGTRAGTAGTTKTKFGMREDKWARLLRRPLDVSKVLSRTFKSPMPSLSAGPFSRNLYDPDIGGDRPLLDMSRIVVNDREYLSAEEQGDRVAHIHAFDDWRSQIIDTVALLNVGLSMVTAPLTFLWGGMWQDPSSVPGGRTLLVFDLVMDILFALYLVVLLDMSYLHPNLRIEVITWRKIVQYRSSSVVYWLKWVGTTVYFWAIAFGAPLSLNIIKFVRCGMFFELPDSLWRLRDMSGVRIMTPVVLLMVVAHWVACLLFWIGGYLDQLRAEGEDYFETTFWGTAINGNLSAYVIAYVEAIYMLTGSLDGPTGDGARDGNFGALVMVVIFAPIGQLVVAMFIATIVQEANAAMALDMRHNENKAYIQRALQILGVPKDLRRRVFSMHYFQKMSHDHEALQLLFNKKHLSSSLCTALQLYLYRHSVLDSTYFRGKDPNYIIEVVRILKDEVCLPGDYVTRRGEIAHTMYFVARGQLTVLIHDVAHLVRMSMAKEVSTMERGEVFGQVALIKESVRTASIRSNHYAVLSSLSRFDIEPIWKYFPEEREEMVMKVADTVTKDRKRLVRNRWQKALRPELHHLKGKHPEEAERSSCGRRSRREEALDAAEKIGDDADGNDAESTGVLELDGSAALPDAEPDSVKRILDDMLDRQATLRNQLMLVMDALGLSSGELPWREEECSSRPSATADRPQVVRTFPERPTHGSLGSLMSQDSLSTSGHARGSLGRVPEDHGKLAKPSVAKE